jgi:hypothetical protein
LHTSTSCGCGYANPSENWRVFPDTLNRNLGSDRGEAGDIPEDDIPGDANLVVCNLGDVLLAVCGPVYDRLQVVAFQVDELREVSRRQVVVVPGVRSQEAGSVDYRRRVDCPFQAWRAAARQSVDDSSKNYPQRHLLLVAYSDDQG